MEPEMLKDAFADRITAWADRPARKSFADTPLQRMIDASLDVRRIAQFQALADAHVAQADNGFSSLSSGGGNALPDKLKSGVESLSGLPMDDVKVHYNSDKPAQLQAHAYAQGTDIHLAPGQEKHLAHEAWHVVQQKEGRVPETAQLKGVGLNDDAGLEREADVMGAKAEGGSLGGIIQMKEDSVVLNSTIQRKEVAQRVIARQNGVTDDFIARCLDVSPAVAAVIQGWEQLPGLRTFASRDNFIDHVMAERVHGVVSNTLGLPVNATEASMTQNVVDQGKEAAFSILGKMEAAWRRKFDPQGNANPVTKMIADAAISIAVGAGVCDNFGSLSAVIMRIIGMSGVALRTEHGHKNASVNGILVDPWRELLHSGRPENQAIERMSLDALDPEDLEQQLFAEVDLCSALLELVLRDECPQAEREAYLAFRDRRAQSGFGNLGWRQNRQQALDQERDQRRIERENKKALLAAAKGDVPKQ